MWLREFSMKTRLARTLHSKLCISALWKHLSSFLIVTIVTTVLHQHQVCTAPGRSIPSVPLVSSPSASGSPSETNEALTKPDALARLSKVFGISRIPHREFHRSPPQYMQDLYATITDTGGLTRASGPYNSNVIRSFPDKGKRHPIFLTVPLYIIKRRGRKCCWSGDSGLSMLI